MANTRSMSNATALRDENVLRRVRHLGSARDGLAEWRLQRRTAGTRRARRQLRIERIGFECRGLCPPRSFHRRRDQRGRDAPPAIAFAHVEAGERPDGHIIHALEPPRAIKPRQRIARRQLAPADGHVAIEGEQARRRTALHDPSKRRPVSLARSLAIGAADPPIHAPTVADGGIFAEQILKCRPQIGSEWADRELHAAVAFIMFASRGHQNNGRRIFGTQQTGHTQAHLHRLDRGRQTGDGAYDKGICDPIETAGVWQRNPEELMPASHLQTLRAMAYNNAWANHRLLTACAKLTQAEFEAPRTGFFPSIQATLNHILIIDRFYVDALEGGTLGPAAWADPVPCPTVSDLRPAQTAVDGRLVAWCKALDEPGIDRIIHVHRGTRVQTERADRLLLHLFQHQIHDRGQAHAMLSSTPVALPQLDEFFSVAEGPLRANEFSQLGWTEATVWRE